MKISWYDASNSLCADYLNLLDKKFKETAYLTEDVRNLLNEFFQYADYDGRDDNFESYLNSFAEKTGIDNVAELFDGELKEIPLFLLGEEWLKLWSLFVKAEADSTYTTGYARRSVRSKNVGLHIRNIAVALKDFLILKSTGFSTLEILMGGRTKEEIEDTIITFDRTAWLTAMIKSGDKECIDYIKEAMISENNAKRLCRDFLRAVVKSGNKELLELEGKLLLAASLQEGLRQAIVETMDEGTPESYIYMLKVIKDNNLHRFAAIKRGLAVTTGLGETNAPERINDKFVNLVYTYLNNSGEAEKAVESHDAMEVYLGLWSLAFFNVDDIRIPIEKIIDTAPPYRVEAAMLMLETIQNPALSCSLVSKVIHSRYNEHAVIAGALSLYLSYSDYYIGLYSNLDSVPPLDKFFSSREDAIYDFELLVKLIESVKNTETFNPYVFPWLSMTLSRSDVAIRIVKVALLLDSSEYVDRALDYVEYMDSFDRATAIRFLLKNPVTSKQVTFAVNGMSDRGTEARDTCCEIVRRLHEYGKLTPEHYLVMEDFLRLKAANMRITIIAILSSLPDVEATVSINRLLANNIAERRLAGLDILKNWIDKGERMELVESILSVVKDIKRPTSKEKVLIDNILDSVKTNGNIYNAANGFGLYNPNDELQLEVERLQDFDIEKALSFSNPDRAINIMCKVMKLIEENADYEFVNYWGETVRMGNSPKVKNYGEGLAALAKPEMWKEFYEKEINSPSDMLRLEVAIIDFEEDDMFFFPLFERLLGKAFHKDSLIAELKKLPYYSQALEVCKCLIYEYSSSPDTLRTCVNILSEAVTTLKAEEMVGKHDYGQLSYFREDYSILDVWPFCRFCGMLKSASFTCDDKLFVDSFMVRYEFYRKLGYKKDFNPTVPYEYLRLWDMGLISNHDFWHEMIGREASPDMVDSLTDCLPKSTKKYTWKKNTTELNPAQCTLINEAVDRVLEIELQRGDTPTVVTKLANKINVVSGIDYLIKILVGLGKEKPKCGFWGLGDSKRDTFTWLLHVSCPADNDTAKQMKEKAKEAGISDERLVEAAMYSPRWLELVEEAIGWKGLESATYYFIAHTGERLDDNVKSHISRYTSVTPEDFADGAFDPVWFREVYKQLGKKHFEVVYDAAKYISEGNRHTRARKLSDASLGILKAKDVQKGIVEKRNKDLVVAFGLIPLGRNKMKDLRQRYTLLNKFLKESKQFGAQRQASESRAVKLALDNLARTAGFGDSTRLTWSMEANLVKEVAEYLSPKEIDGVTVYIELGEGAPELVMESKGKRLQSMPARLKKEKYVEQMREVYKQLKDQHVRGRTLLENSMVDSSVFTGDEIAQLRENPIIWIMFSRLILVKNENQFGFPGDDGHSIISADGEVTVIYPDDSLRIAHPYDFMVSGVWSQYQSVLFERQWRQPFKQVFRELYVPTKEEKEQTRSMRYAGNQIMPARAVGVLKKRLWVVDYENGLQKVCFNGDVTAVMYAMADWFSPSDIEAPTLEYVAFYDRRSFKGKKIEDVQPIVFSEIMRDVDLAVSVAHAGGVDPEASHSTIEMRRVIVEHAMSMFGISNVEVTGNFAKIKGELGGYNIHLGSGIIHKEGGAQIVVLPVHSQGRGRIFLPFLDEDPKTAEIISKILLFAEDTKIKDPSILNQI